MLDAYPKHRCSRLASRLAVFGLTAFAGFLIACSKPPSLQSDAEAAVKLTLRDPDSAQFSDWTFYPTDKAACGSVNSKNGFGGYSGRIKFVYQDGRATLAEPQDNLLSVLKTCTKLAEAELARINAKMEAANAVDGEKKVAK